MSAFDANEHREHAEHAAETKDPFISRVSITIACLAVLAAVVGSLETVENGIAITDSSRAVLAQDRATDTWNEYQADSLKKHVYGIAADQPGPNAARYKKVAADQVAKQADLLTKAKAGEDERERWVHESEAHEKRHHWLTFAATLLEIGIGMSTVSIVTRKRSFWMAAVGLGVVGMILFAVAYVVPMATAA
jgi:hypothetical protein